MEKIPFDVYQQIIQCFGTCFHYKHTMASFMRTCGVPEDLIDTNQDKAKFG